MANSGKTTESLVREALKHIERYRESTFLRLYDSTSAGFGGMGGGNLIPSQPGDFLLQIKGLRTVLIECKSSEIYASLAEASMRKIFTESQILGARLWHRSGGLSLAVFQPLGRPGVIEVWYMQDVVKAYLSPPRKRKLLGAPCKVTPIAPSRTVTPAALGTALVEIISTKADHLAY